MVMMAVLVIGSSTFRSAGGTWCSTTVSAGPPVTVAELGWRPQDATLQTRKRFFGPPYVAMFLVDHDVDGDDGKGTPHWQRGRNEASASLQQ